MHQHNISGLPVVDDGRVVGILTNRDLRFERALERKVGVMSTELRLLHRVRVPSRQRFDAAPQN